MSDPRPTPGDRTEIHASSIFEVRETRPGESDKPVGIRSQEFRRSRCRSSPRSLRWPVPSSRACF